MDYTKLVLIVYKLEHEALAVDSASFKRQTCSHMWGFLQLLGTRTQSMGKVCPVGGNFL